jgi:WD40 repeat protein
VGRQTSYFVAASGGRLQTWPLDSDVVGTPVDGPTISAPNEHLAVSRDGRYVAVPIGSTVSVYRWETDHIGTLVATQTLPGAARGVAWAPDGSAIAVAHTTTPFVSVYRWTSSGFQTQYANPATLPTGNARAVSFHPGGAAIAVAHTTTPFVSAYPWDVTTGFGAKYANPATLPGANSVDVRFRGRSGSHVAVMWNGNPGFAVYPFTVASGLGVKLANPTTGANQTGEGCDWSADGQILAVGDGGTTGGAHFYSLASGAIGNVVTFNPGGDARDVRFSPDGRYVGFYLTASPYLVVFRYSPTASQMQALGALPSVAAAAGPIVWGATGGVGAPTGNHPVQSAFVTYAAAVASDWDPDLPVQVQHALDLLAARTAQLQALVDYIIAQTGIVLPDVASTPAFVELPEAPVQPPEPSVTIAPTPQ